MRPISLNNLPHYNKETKMEGLISLAMLANVLSAIVWLVVVICEDPGATKQATVAWVVTTAVTLAIASPTAVLPLMILANAFSAITWLVTILTENRWGNKVAIGTWIFTAGMYYLVHLKTIPQ